MANWSDIGHWDALRDGTQCPICTSGAPKDVAAQLKATWVTVPKVAPLPGYACIVSKRHVVEPYELPVDERQEFWEDALSVAALVEKEYQPIKLNYEIHGNSIPHLHLHVLPRFRGDPFENGPIDFRIARRRSDSELGRMRTMLQRLVRER